MSKKAKQIRLLTLSSIMASLYIMLDLVTEYYIAPAFGGNLKISISGLPVIIVSIIGGPLWGAATGFIGEFIVQILTYGLTPTTILWVIPSAARGLLMGLLFIAFKKSMNYFLIILESSVSAVIVTLLNTAGMYIDSLIYKYSVAAVIANLPTRILTGVVSAIVMAILLPPIVKLLNKIIIKT